MKKTQQTHADDSTSRRMSARVTRLPAHDGAGDTRERAAGNILREVWKKHALTRHHSDGTV